MKKFTNLFFLIFSLFVCESYSQTARLQVIHNSPDAAAAEVDVYINGELEIDNFAFRTATSFIDVAAGVPISIDVAPASSSSAAESLYNLTTTLANGETYIAIANGIVSETGYTNPDSFLLSVFPQGRESATSTTNTDVLVNHGSPDAPAVDVVETSVPAGTIVGNIAFPNYAGYLELATADYTLDVRPAGSSTTVASYSAPLQTLTLNGAAITVIASGFLNPAANSNGPAFGLFVATAAGGALIPLPTSSARLQVIHNSPDAAAAEVDVYINGELEIDNFAFRTATSFIDVAAGVPISIDVAPASSSSAAESLYNLTTTLANGETYIAIANGIVSETGYTNPDSFLLSVFPQGRESATSTTNTDVLVNHGSPDAPAVDVVETSVPAGTIVGNIAFPNYAGYLELATADYTLDVRPAGSSTTVASYSAPLQTLTLNGAAITVIASGFLNPAANSNGPAFGLFVATAAGGALIPLPTSSARLQVIHNSPDAAAAEVDVYINGELEIDNFAFRTATSFIDVAAGVPISIDVAPASSSSAAESLYNLTTTLANGETYIAIANGIVSETGYTNPDSFLLSVFPQGRESATSTTNTDVLVNHGSPDAPAVDVVETSVPAGAIVENIAFPNYAGYLELPTADYTLDVRPAGSSTTVASYSAPLQTLDLNNSAITVIASGFLNPAANSNGPAFGLFVATAAGGALIPLPTSSARLQVIHNSPDAAAAEVDVYINGELEIDNFAFRTATSFIDVAAGVPISIDVAPASSSSAAESLYNLTTTLANGETYIAIANGIVSETGYTNPDSFLLSVFPQGRESATSTTNTDVLVNHGSPDAPAVDVVETSVPAGAIVENIAFPNYAGYLELPTADYTLDVRPAGSSTTVASYSAPLQTLELNGAAITVVASGFLDPAANSNGPAFGLWVATAEGGELLELPLIPLSTNELELDGISVYPNPTNSQLNITIPFAFGSSKATLYDVNGRAILTDISTANPIDVSRISSGIYMLSINIDDKVAVRKVVIGN